MHSAQQDAKNQSYVVKLFMLQASSVLPHSKKLKKTTPVGAPLLPGMCRRGHSNSALSHTKQFRN